MLGRGSKASGRRRHLSSRLSQQQDQALSSSIYLLREMGPTGFLLREEEPENKDFRVFLGNPHVCNCSTFLKGEELCKHICWEKNQILIGYVCEAKPQAAEILIHLADDCVVHSETFWCLKNFGLQIIHLLSKVVFFPLTDKGIESIRPFLTGSY